MLSSLLPTVLAKAAAVIGSFAIGTTSLAVAGVLPGPIQDRIDGHDAERVATVVDALEATVAPPPGDGALAAAHLPEPGTPLTEVAADVGEHAEELGQVAEERIDTFIEQVDPDTSHGEAATERLDEVAAELAQRAPELDESAEQARQLAVDALAAARQQAQAHAAELAARLETERQRLLDQLADVRTRVEAHGDHPLAAVLLGQLDDIAARIEDLELGDVDALDGWFDAASGLLDSLGEPAPSELGGSLLDGLRERLTPPVPAG